MQELKARYTPLSRAACEALWVSSFEEAGEARPDAGRAPLRHKTVHILGGAVMRSWGAVQVRERVRDWRVR